MVRRVLLLTNLFLCCILVSCTSTQETFTLLNVKDTALHRQNRLVYYQHERFSGVLYELHETDTLSRASYLNGKLHGCSEEWYTNGQKKVLRYYEEGNKTGKHYGWWENGKMSFEMEYQQDVFSGSIKEWNERCSRSGR